MSENHHVSAVRKALGNEAVCCPHCGSVAATCDAPAQGTGYKPGECFVFSCSACTGNSWAFCKSCEKRFGNNNTAGHARNSKRHKKNSEAIYGNLETANKKAANAAIPNVATSPATSNNTKVSFALEGLLEENSNDYIPPGADESQSIGDYSTGKFIEMMDQELGDVPVQDNNGDLGAEESTEIPPDIAELIRQYPLNRNEGNQWLARTFKETPRASLQEITEAFPGSKLINMRAFWLAEHASPPGRCGGGLRYLTGKAFGNRGKGALLASSIPDFDEAQWQFESFIQYHSMNEKQRKRQSRITKTLMDHSGGETTFFKKTYVPEYKDLSRIYGKTGQNSMWNCLPVPPVENIDGVAYISPIHIIQFMFANGVPVDEVVVTFPPTDENSDDDDDGERLVFHVSQTKVVREWIREIQANWSPEDEERVTCALVCPMSNWEDGFGPSRVKNNRGSVNAITVTCSAPKELNNAINNTFLMGVGLKKSNGWIPVSHRAKQDFEKLAEKAFRVYHGGIQKVIPVFLKRVVSMADKVARPEATITGTMGPTANQHRRFGVSGKIQTPKCDVGAAKKFLEEERQGIHLSEYGWSENFIMRDSCNGGAFGSCGNCRLVRLVEMGVLKVSQNSLKDIPKPEDCIHCADWDILCNKGDLLAYEPSKHYPQTSHQNCPVEPPSGREVGLKQLKPVRMTFESMIQASRFAHYHSSRPRKQVNWTKTICKAYLNSCGVGSSIQNELYASAVAARGHDDVDYEDKTCIGTFQWPASWFGDVSLRDHIEMVMHQLFQGLAGDILDFSSKWFVKSNAKDQATATFRKGINPLLLDLKKFRLSWLHVYHFSSDDQSTGAWVGENFLAFVRLFSIVFGWSCRDPDAAMKDGVKDLQRVVRSYYTFVSRMLTHAGVNRAIARSTALYMKEFLSCVKELEIRLRYPEFFEVGGKAKGQAEAIWLRANMMSLANLIEMLLRLGPAIIWWDGGGKGEKFLQEIKPHIKRGVREDSACFFVILSEKIYRLQQIIYLEKRYGLADENLIEELEEELQQTWEELISAVWASESHDDQSGNGKKPESMSEDLPCEDDEEDDEEDESEDESEDEDWAEAFVDNSPIEEDLDMYSKVEDQGMTKKSTIYVYPNEALLDSSIAGQKPIAGILRVVELEGQKVYEFYAVFRKPVKLLVQRRVRFGDDDGEHFCGMWYADITVEAEHLQETGSFEEIQATAKMSAVAIPMRYIVGDDQDNAGKYCVITNWWKERVQTGDYVLPELVASHYKDTHTQINTDEDMMDQGANPDRAI